MPSKDAPVAIAGAGIGGLTAALALSHAGRKVCIVERASELREAGAGLQLSPNACRVLRQLDVLDALEPVAVAPAAIQIANGQTGREVASVPLGESISRRFGNPYWVVHRADLQNALLAAVKRHTDIDLRLGCEVTEVVVNGPRHVAFTLRHAGTEQPMEADALIGADGVWSSLRSIIPAQHDARFAGQTAYRTTIPAAGLPSWMLINTGLWLGPDAHVVHYPISGGDKLNLVVLVEEDWTGKTWSEPASPDAVAGALANWSPVVQELAGRASQWLKWALCRVDASRPWTDQRLALLGDAAHAMLPFVAQGAAMAIEDAAVLATSISAQKSLPAALKTYEAARKPRVRKVQALAERNARIYHLSGPMAFGRDTALRLMGPKRLADQMDWIYRWTAPR